MTGYTVEDHVSGQVLMRGVSLHTAALAILLYNDARYEIRKEGDVSNLFVGNSYNNNMPRTTIGSGCEDPDEAYDDICRQVVEARWPNMPQAMTDEQYDKMIASS